MLTTKFVDIRITTTIGIFSMTKIIIGLILSLCSFLISAQQTQTDSYTRYELLSPDTNSFRILYYVSVTNAGAEYYFNPLRKGSEHVVNAVTAQTTGDKLPWEVVNGKQAQVLGLTNADIDTDYLKVQLPNAIPQGGQARILIDKTYKDTNSYFTKDNKIIFKRSLGIKRNSVVLPRNFEVINANYPSQVQLTEQGLVKLSYMNDSDQAVNYYLEGRKVSIKKNNRHKSETPWADNKPIATGTESSHARIDYQFSERAYQNRDIVYFLQPPETHAFRLYHDYTETRQGVDKYLNIVRKGSKASNPSAINLDTGATLKVETLLGNEISKKGIDIGFEPKPDTELVAIWFDAVKKNHSTRIRIEETYTDANRYLLHNDELIWDRSFGRNRNTVILPENWSLTTNSIPAKISLTDDDKIKLRYINGNPGNINVYIKAIRKH
jgi:hypothetical protein